MNAWIAGLLLAGVSAVLACRIAGTDAVTPVPQLLAFLPWLLAPAGVALLLALLGRWWAGVVWGVLVVGLLAWFTDPYGTAGEPTGAPVASFRVLTSNVEAGGGTEALLATVREERPDLVFVQECDADRCDRVLHRDLSGTYPYRQAVGGPGSAGSVVLSRFPLTPGPGVPATMGMPGAVADVHGHAVRLQLAHPAPPVPGQVALWRRELGRLRAVAVAGRGAPLIVAGDFNASQDHAAFRRILDAGLHDAARLAGHDRAPSWPSRTTPVFGTQIDHVLVSADFSVTRARFLKLAGTDHRALVTDVTLHGRSQ